MAEYLRKECGDLNEVTWDNDDVKDEDDDDDDANSKDVEVVKIGTGETLTMVDRLVKLKYLPIKGRKELSCRHKIQIREDKSAEQKAKPYQWLLYVGIKFVS